MPGDAVPPVRVPLDLDVDLDPLEEVIARIRVILRRTQDVPSSESGSAVGVNGLMRSVGTTIAGAVMAAILTSQTVALAPGTPEIPTHDAFKLCFLVGAAAALLGAGLALCVTRAKTKNASLADAGEPNQAGEPEPARS